MLAFLATLPVHLSFELPSFEYRLKVHLIVSLVRRKGGKLDNRTGGQKHCYVTVAQISKTLESEINKTVNIIVLKTSQLKRFVWRTVAAS